MLSCAAIPLYEITSIYCLVSLLISMLWLMCMRIGPNTWAVKEQFVIYIYCWKSVSWTTSMLSVTTAQTEVEEIVTKLKVYQLY